MRILLVNQAYHPDHAATAQHARDLVRSLTAQGHQVTVVASRSLYGHGGALLPAKETIDGAQILRVGRSLFGKRHLAGRAADFALFYLAATSRMLTLPRQDVVIALTTPPLIGLAGWVVTRVRGGRLVSWVMDLYPEVAVAGGVLAEKSLFTRLLCALNRFALKRSARVVTLGRCMQERLLALGVTEAQLALIPPWAAEESPSPAKMDAKEEPAPLTVMYAGNLGLAHDIAAFKEALMRLAGDGRIRFVFSGGGKRRQELESFAKTQGLAQVAFLPHGPREGLAAELAKADIHLVSQAAAFTGLVVPSKFYGILAAGRAVAVVAPEDAEISRAVHEAGCGRVFAPDPGGGAELAAWLTRLADDRAQIERLGERARNAHDMRHSVASRLTQWANLLGEATARTQK